jgi:hypothetical protein
VSTKPHHNRFRAPPYLIASILSSPKDSDMSPFFLPHFNWAASITGLLKELPITISSLIDCGCPTVLIRNELITTPGLKKRKLPHPEAFDVALHENSKEKRSVILHDWCLVTISDPTSCWHSKSVHAIVTPELCSPLIFVSALGTRFSQGQISAGRPGIAEENEAGKPRSPHLYL